MTADSRFPNMHPVDGRDLPGVHQLDGRAITRWARRVAARTQTRAWWNDETWAVHFCPADVSASPYAPRVVRPDRTLSLPSEDDAARTIRSGKMPRRMKDGLIAGARRRGQHDRQEAIEKMIEDATPDMRDRAAHRLHGRVSAMVS